MNHAVKRTVAGSITCPNGLPQLTDLDLAQRVSLLPLPANDHERAVKLCIGLVPDKYGLLRKKDRDWLMQTASANGALPKFPHKRKVQGSTNDTIAPDRYMERETKGTLLACSIISKQVPALGGTMPTPPRRRHW
jgi:hypothetical protein